MTGQILQEPIDKFNHAMDALRYVALNKLAKKVTRRGIRTKLKASFKVSQRREADL